MLTLANSFVEISAVRESAERAGLFAYITVGHMWTKFHEFYHKYKGTSAVPDTLVKFNEVMREHLINKGYYPGNFDRNDKGIDKLKYLYELYSAYPCIALISGMSPTMILKWHKNFYKYLGQDSNVRERCFWMSLPVMSLKGELVLPMWSGQAKMKRSALSDSMTLERTKALYKLLSKAENPEEEDGEGEDGDGREGVEIGSVKGDKIGREIYFCHGIPLEQHVLGP